MDINEKEFSPQESLLIIRSMIESTKHSISDNSHFFLLWGYATFIGCALQFFLLAIVHYEHHYYAWFVTPLAVLLHVYYLFKYKRTEKVKTFISEASGYVWTIIGFSYMALGFVFTKIGWQFCFPVYIMLYGIGTYISGSLIKFKPMKIGGLVCLFFVAIAPYLDYTFQILLSALAILISYIIPGHLLRSQYQRANKKSNY
jgi:Flp pilus assembly protein TadB